MLDGEEIELGLKNPLLKVMKRALRELPESLEKEINDAITNFETEFGKHQEDLMVALEQVLQFDQNQDNEQEILDFIEKAKKMRWDPSIKRLENQILEKVKLASAGVHQALNLISIETI